MSARARGLLTKTFPGSNSLLCPIENSLAFRREPHIALTALHDGHAEFFFKMTNPGGQGGLRNAADFCRTGKMLFPRERHQIFKLTNEHGLAGRIWRESMPSRRSGCTVGVPYRTEGIPQSPPEASCSTCRADPRKAARHSSPPGSSAPRSTRS